MLFKYIKNQTQSQNEWLNCTVTAVHEICENIECLLKF